MNYLALITGASSGIGRELATLHAKAGGDLVLVARSKDKLDQVKSELESRYHISATVIAADLSKAGAAQAVFATTEHAGLKVDVLMNNAGFGDYGKFHLSDLARNEAMMQLNMATLTSLTHLYLPAMVERNCGKILNVASTAGFIPGPLLAVYYGTKAYVLSFSQAISEELSDTNITVTALCPGPVDTEFAERGKLQKAKAFDHAASAQSVAACGYRAMEQGKLIAINDLKLNILLNWLVPLLPRRWVMKASRRIMKSSD